MTITETAPRIIWYSPMTVRQALFRSCRRTSLEEMGYSTSDARGLYIADALYVVTQGGISSFDMKDGYGKIGEME